MKSIRDLYMGNLDWLPYRTVYLTVHGSHAYGTARPTSDWDYRGVAVPPKDYFLGLKLFEQAEQKGDPDLVVFALRKFVGLAAAGNPNVLEILYTAPEDHRLVSRLGRKLLDHRDLFLSRRVKHTFSGYAVSQLKRMETHRRWLLNPPQSAPNRAAYGLPPRTLIPRDQLMAAESMMRKVVDSWALDLEPLEEASKLELQGKLGQILAEMRLATDSDQMRAAAGLLGFSDNFMQLLDKERLYNTAHREWEQYQQWKASRNAARAELEARHGYDTKHAMHLVRLMRMCREMLTEGVVRVKRPDAQELSDIRDGAWSYDQILSFSQEQDAALNQLYTSSVLPQKPNMTVIEKLLMSLHEWAVTDPTDAFAPE